MRRIAFVVHGRVQGVGFRAATRAAASQHGILGFVANHGDGTVRGEAQGDDAALQAFQAWLQQGPAFARVDQVWFAELAPRADEVAFVVRR